jgi:hypothetical protein
MLPGSNSPACRSASVLAELAESRGLDPHAVAGTISLRTSAGRSPG